MSVCCQIVHLLSYIKTVLCNYFATIENLSCLMVHVDVLVRGNNCVMFYDVNNLGPFCVVDSSIVCVFSGLSFRVLFCGLPVCATVCCSCDSGTHRGSAKQHRKTET
jgi:hypothetical protein